MNGIFSLILLFHLQLRYYILKPIQRTFDVLYNFSANTSRSGS